MRGTDAVAAPSAHGAPVAMSRHAAFLALVAGTVAWFWAPLATVITLSLQYGEYEHYSHIVTIPVISLALLYMERATIFSRVQWRPGLGVPLMLAAVAASWLPRLLRISDESGWSVSILAAVAACAGAFIACYGADAFRKAAFPLLLLAFMAPFPPPVLHAVIAFLQRASAEASAVLFDLLGVPVFREGFMFTLPGLRIEIAEECSGIRSSMALVVVGLVAAHIFLRSLWSKLAIALLVVPIAVVKNAVRIVVLSLLGIYADPDFVGPSVLHRYSGIPVFMLGFGILGALIWMLGRSETWVSRRATRAAR